MSPWLFNIYMDGVMREVKGKVGEVGVRMYAERRKEKKIGEERAKLGEVGVKMYNAGRKWVLNSILFADDTVLIAENE